MPPWFSLSICSNTMRLLETGWNFPSYSWHNPTRSFSDVLFTSFHQIPRHTMFDTIFISFMRKYVQTILVCPPVSPSIGCTACPSWRPTNNVDTLKAKNEHGSTIPYVASLEELVQTQFYGWGLNSSISQIGIWERHPVSKNITAQSIRKLPLEVTFERRDPPSARLLKIYRFNESQ